MSEKSSKFGTPLPIRGGFSAASLCRLVLKQFSLRIYVRIVQQIHKLSGCFLPTNSVLFLFAYRSLYASIYAP